MQVLSLLNMTPGHVWSSRHVPQGATAEVVERGEGAATNLFSLAARQELSVGSGIGQFTGA